MSDKQIKLQVAHKGHGRMEAAKDGKKVRKYYAVGETFMGTESELKTFKGRLVRAGEAGKSAPNSGDAKKAYEEGFKAGAEQCSASYHEVITAMAGRFGVEITEGQSDADVLAAIEEAAASLPVTPDEDVQAVLDAKAEEAEDLLPHLSDAQLDVAAELETRKGVQAAIESEKAKRAQ